MPPLGCPAPAAGLHRVQKANHIQPSTRRGRTTPAALLTQDASSRLSATAARLNLDRAPFLLRVVKLRRVSSVMSPSVERRSADGVAAEFPGRRNMRGRIPLWPLGNGGCGRYLTC